MTLEDWEAIERRQAARCAICLGAGELVVDHDHGSGRVRGLLCHPCNRALGQFADDAAGLRRAAAYVDDRTTSAEARTLVLRRLEALRSG